MKLDKKESILLRGSNLWNLGTGLFGPLLAVFTEEIGGSILDISYAWATYLIVTGVFTILVGKYSDGHQRKERLLVASYFLNVLFTFLLLVVSSPTQLFLNQFGFGIALALSTPTWQALYAQYEDKKRPSYTWGLVSGEAVIISGAAVILGALIVKYFSFDVLFMIMGGVQLIAALFMLQVLRK